MEWQKNLSCLTYIFLAEVEQDGGLLFYFSFRAVNKCAFCGLFSFLHICALCVCVCVYVISLFKVALSCNAEVLSNVLSMIKL